MLWTAVRRVVLLGSLVLLAASGCADRAQLGRSLYAKHGCAACHGKNGRGDGPVARTLNPPPRDFADTAHYKQGSSPQAIADSIKNGVFGSRTMPPFDHISNDDTQLLAAWIVSLQQRADTAPDAGRQ